MPKEKNRYIQIIESIFHKKFKKGLKQIDFTREEFITTANELKIPVPKNVGDILYSFRNRIALPESILKTAPHDSTWVIRSLGKSKHRFELAGQSFFIPSSQFLKTKIPDATPGIIKLYAMGDEQALLAIIRYNRLIDIFTGVTCYSLQNHLRTTVNNIGQVESDELYVGVDKKGIHYIIPVQAKGRGSKERLGLIQIEQDYAMAKEKFPNLVCKMIGSKLVEDGSVALMEFAMTPSGIAIANEKHYLLVRPEELTNEELENYKLA